MRLGVKGDERRIHVRSGVTRMFIDKFAINSHNAHYDGQYSASELEWRRLGAIDKVNNLAATLGGRTASSVLEVGCGTGAVLAEISRRGIGERHVGIDMADPAEHIDPGAKGLELHVYDGNRLPFEDNSFDLVIASHVVEHVPDPRGFLAELSRVSANLLYLEVPCEMNVRSNARAIQRSLGIGHINGFTPEYFMVLLQTAGLDIVDLQVFDHSYDVHKFGVSALRGYGRMAIRRTMLRSVPHLATKLFCYHCGALAKVAGENAHG
jgi:SAM-dependent methyltransferase